ncbi:hypothetical protein [Spirillospora albida]|uniref:hypothetical protein n=1 Tax=Spirillospora albida TaxID=58123 RepID=UPI0012FABB46|nr:hypothetical protein [Spirillospora albida]
MQAGPGRPNGWWISPAVPTIANCALAVLWAFSGLGGWGEAAFCGTGTGHDLQCGADFATAVSASLPVAALAAGIGVAAWTTPSVRHRPQRLDALLATAAAVWMIAEGILFVGGYQAKP